MSIRVKLVLVLVLYFACTVINSLLRQSLIKKVHVDSTIKVKSPANKSNSDTQHILDYPERTIILIDISKYN